MKRYLIYTVLTGSNYDNLLQLSCISDEFDYICFTNKEVTSPKAGIWKLEKIEDVTKDSARLSRYPKLAPHKTKVSDYEFSLYIDANIDIKGTSIYSRFIELAKDDCKIAMLKHPFRDCVYQEAYVCVAACKGGWIDIIRQIIALKLAGIKTHAGLYEANMIFRKHNDPNIVDLDDLWWNTFMNYSKRDQLSFVYSLHKLGVTPSYFLQPGLTTRNHPDLEKVMHNRQAGNVQLSFKKKIVNACYGIFKSLLKEK